MKKIKITAFALAAVLSSAPVLAAEVPQEAVPVYLTDESVCITENLISPILEEVQNGLGFGEAWARQAVKSIPQFWRAVQTLRVCRFNRNRTERDPAIPGYVPAAGLLRTAGTYRKGIDFRPNTRSSVNGTMDYATARKEAYTRIYQSVNPGYAPNTDMTIDPIYLDIPAVDSAMFTIARKLLLEAVQ